MICPNCGRDIPDGTVCPCSAGARALSSNPALNVLKTIGSSPLFLVAAILYSVSIVCSFITALSQGSGVDMGALYQMADLMDIDPYYLFEVTGAMNNASGASVVGVIIGLVPTILIALGMWLHYVSCRDVKSGGVSTAGLTICKVISIITLVFICIGAAASLVFLILGIAGAGLAFSEADPYGYNAMAAGATIGIVIFVFLMLLVFLVLAFFYYLAVVKAINRMKNTANTGVPDNRVSRYLIVLNYIMAVLTAISGIVALFNAPLNGLGMLVAAAAQFLIAMCLGRYRQEMTMLMYPPVQPVYAAQPAQAPVQPQVPVQPEAPQEQKPEE